MAPGGAWRGRDKFSGKTWGGGGESTWTTCHEVHTADASRSGRGNTDRRPAFITTSLALTGLNPGYAHMADDVIIPLLLLLVVSGTKAFSWSSSLPSSTNPAGPAAAALAASESGELG